MINVLAELDRNGIQYVFANQEEVKICCPFHEDGSPSCHVNLDKNLFKCMASSCLKAGDFVTLLTKLLNTTRKAVLTDLGTRYTLNNEPTVSAAVIEKYHARIWAAQPLVAQLHKRAVTDHDIRKHRLGEWQGRITIPIKNDAGLFVNVRSYLPGAPGADKMKNLRGRGSKLRLYPIEQLAYNKIVLCGGEMKAIVASRILNPHGIGAITVTAGEGIWHPSLTPLFMGKEVWVCLDIDEAGRIGADTLCKFLNPIAVAVHDVVLPMDLDVYPKGDINDFVKAGLDLHRAVIDTPRWVAKSAKVLAKTSPREVTLGEASNAAQANQRIKVSATVTTLDTSPYVIPHTLTIDCSRDLKECVVCPVYTNPDDYIYEIQDESPAIMEMTDQKKQAQQFAIMEEFEIPMTCRSCRFRIIDYYNVEDCRISPQLEITERTNEKALQPALCIGPGLDLNESYELIGRMHPHPQTQQSTLMISAYKPKEDSLGTYQCQDLDSLQIFKPEEWTLEGVEKKLSHIVNDFEANVTRVFQRPDIHIMADLAYHSPLFITFEGKKVKGWTEILIVGDSSQGKSETVINLQGHYGLGEKVECKNATVAGLLGGLQQFGSRWFVTWGLIPTHDRRLVILEELKGTSTDVIGKLTDMRSSGFADLPKIEKRRTYARTRLIALSNPRGSLSISQHNFGIEAIFDLIGSLEDVRRFDACLIVQADEVDARVVNALQTSRPHVEHVYTSALCRELVLWAWTVDDVTYEDEATKEILEQAILMCDKYSEAIPIVDRGSMRYKLARLSAAVAARTFSATGPKSLLVRKCHVEYISKLLQSVYDRKSFGYLDFTESKNISSKLVDPEVIEKHVNATPFPADIVKQLLYTQRIELQDICDWCSWDRTTAQGLLGLLVRKQALIRERRHYRKTSPFIELLKRMKPLERPKFIEEIEF